MVSCCSYSSNLSDLNSLSLCCVGVTVEFGSPEASFNESDGVYRMCIVKDRETAQRVTVQITDTPGTADRNQGIHTLRK